MMETAQEIMDRVIGDRIVAEFEKLEHSTKIAVSDRINEIMGQVAVTPGSDDFDPWLLSIPLERWPEAKAAWNAEVKRLHSVDITRFESEKEATHGNPEE